MSSGNLRLEVEVMIYDDDGWTILENDESDAKMNHDHVGLAGCTVLEGKGQLWLFFTSLNTSWAHVRGSNSF